MSRPVDVLAVMKDAVRYEVKAGGAEEWVDELCEARAAVAALVEAARRLLAHVEDMDLPRVREECTVCHSHRQPLHDALAKFGGAA